MPHEDSTQILAGWDGYRVSHVERFEAGRQGPTPEIWISLLPLADRVKRCSGCCKKVAQVHDVTERWIRDLPILDAVTWLCVPRCRVACPRCGPTLEQLPWLDKYMRVTRRLADSVGRLCQVASIKHVAGFFGMKWDAVKAIDKWFLQRTVGQPDLSDVEILAMDEFAIQKGHRYATVIIDPIRKQVLWVGRGRGREDIRPFFEMLGPAGRKRIRAVAMDMSPAFENEVRFQCPDAEIVFDLFHVVAKYSREVIDRVRVDEANRLRHDKKARKVI
jgi:transposase